MKYKNKSDDLTQERMQSKYSRKGRVRHHTYTWDSASTKYRIFIMGNEMTCVINSKYIIAATLCTLETLFPSST